ncbi:type I polyketide synthase [Aspergillus alliaceus]|uniref:type I polyketide synthase n=1 Tax=Petromyces alliaceus TaxID=209559 RepID=UPI0012A6CA1E|nr:polyketide synthase [Aspergillus alliaceus]KAB8228301.1 polyketide synthase [Aspergillus alliaceus]
MAMRLPGRVRSGTDFWNLLSAKESGLCDVPKDRFNIHGFSDASGRAGTIPIKQGYFLEDVDIQQFDTYVFPTSRMELARLDPAQRQLLQVAYECFESAGISSWRGSRVGCYVGELGEDWADVNAKETQHRGGYRGTGFGDFAMSNRISYEFDLLGPSMTVKTACSSSLVCLDLACKAIQNNECVSALVGGTNLMFSPTTWMALNDQGVLSPTGQCRTFDAAADGYARGEAVNMVLVKRLSSALRDNDPIRVVIRGTGVNSDGRTQGMLTPSPSAQAALIRRTYAAAGIQDLSETAIVECHGTGTPVGDPLETKAIADCFGDKGVIITSVKPNIGHSEGAAGLTSLIKSVLVLEHRTVLPNINFDTPNPEIPFEERKLRVPTELEAWPRDRAERVSVNSSGIGGVNAHVIVESPRQFAIASQVDSHYHSRLDDFIIIDKVDVDGKPSNTGQSNGTLANGTHHEPPSKDHIINGGFDTGVVRQGEPPSLFLLSAHSAESLQAQINDYQEYMQSQSHVELRDLAYTLANKREHRAHRAFAVMNGNTSSLQVSEPPVAADWGSASGTKVAWVFTGQGAQWPRMGRELLDTNATFREMIRKMDKFLLMLPMPRRWRVEHELRKGEHNSQVHRAELGHPICVALQIALVDVLRSWGITPDVIVGHSSGEVAAAYASGAISAEAAMAIATLRGSSNVSTDQKGSMAAIGLGRDDVLPYMVPGVDIACENSHSSITLSGDTDQVNKVLETIRAERPGVLARLLLVEKAFHSHHMLQYGKSYEEQIRPYVCSRDPVVALYSSVTGKSLTGDGCLDAHYWRANMERPVLFNTALRSAIGDAALESSSKVVMIEIGPHPALAGPIGQILRDTGHAGHILHIGTLRRGKDCQESMMHLAGKLYQHGIPLNYSVLCPPGNFIKDLPRYSWKQDTTYWAESRLSSEWRFRGNPPHELLGSRVLEAAAIEPTWRKVLALEDVPWLAGHEVNGLIVLPAAGYIAMVGEALQQLHQATDASHEATFSIKNVRIASARILDIDKTIELITSLRPIMLDASEASAWYQFTISSFDGTRWARNCFGEARTSRDNSFAPPRQVHPGSAPFPRLVDEKAWYVGLRRIGFNYTGLFEGMQDVSAATTTTEAKATVATGILPSPSRCSRYVFHPSTIDRCFQLFTVASFRGMCRNMTQLSVPTFIEEMVLHPCPANQTLNVTAHVENKLDRGSFTGSLLAQSTGSDERLTSTCISLKGLKSSALTSGSNDDGDENKTPLLTQFEWRPHSDFADLGSCIHRRTPRVKEWPLLEELILLCMLDHSDNIKTNGDTAEHLVKFAAWMQQQIERYKLGLNKFVRKDLHIEEKSVNERLQRINEILATLSSESAPSQYTIFSTTIYKVFAAASAIFSGEMHPLHVLLEDNVLTEFYEALAVDSTDLIKLLANTNPQMRILEVGAGTGGTTARVLQALTSPYGERLYSAYTYTDVSVGFMPAAKERFADYAAIDYAVLDVTVDPAEQGFQLGSFDLIIAANIIHATPSLNTTLGNLRSLLSPGGRLFMEELSPGEFFQGFLPGWWLGSLDNRVDQPFVSPERWTKELLGAGFSEPDTIVLDNSAPYHVNAAIVASCQSRETSLSRVSLLCHAPNGSYVAEVQHCLEALGVAVDICCFGQALPCQDDVVSLLDLQEPVLHEMSEETFEIVKGYLVSHKASMLWMMPASQVGNVKDPRGSIVLGLARTVRNEMLRRFLTVEVDEATTSATAAAGAVAKILCQAKSEHLNDHEFMDPDFEYAIIHGEILIPRLHWQRMSEAFKWSQPETENDADDVTSPYRIVMQKPGLLHTMMWSKTASSIVGPGEGEILVETRAVGLNLRDVLIALGVLENSPNEMGFEGSGVVRAVGPGVSRFTVGDRVMYLRTGCFKTSCTMNEALCVKMDDSMTFEQGAALPCVYATVITALVDKANLQCGQSVLIHAACGGVGLAAIQIAQMLGAEIYCTVGSDVKRQYLKEHYGIQPSRIFNSRDSSFLPDVLQATDGRGVDVVLNSLSGDLLRASWQCVAEFGTMVEIGKRDFQRGATLAMAPFEANRTFIGLELRFVSQAQPQKATALLERCVQWVREGRIAGPTISSTFGAAQIQEALRTMQAGKHIGKIVIQMPGDAQELELEQHQPVAPAAAFQFRSDRSYLLIGGLGGLGRALANWMVENGARSLVFLSRSALDGPGTDGFVQELHSQGCQVKLVSGSVSNKADVQRAVKNDATAARPLAGVLNLSMVLRDVGFADMSFTDWNAAVEPKVRGTWNLHEAGLNNQELDFFVLFSSCGGITGYWGQANYSAANTFLDSFVQFRHRQGLVASVIDVGVMGDVGFVSQNPDVLDRLDRSGLRILREQDLLDAMVLALRRSRPTQPAASPEPIPGPGSLLPRDMAYRNPSQVILGLSTTIPISSPLNRVVWRRDARMSTYRNLESTSSTWTDGHDGNRSLSQHDSLRAKLGFIPDDEGKAAAIARALAAALSIFLIKDKDHIPLDRPLDSLGLDSLVAMEVRNWIRQQVGVEISTILIVQSPSLRHLAEQIRLALGGATD